MERDARVCSHGHGSRPRADTEAVATRGGCAARAACAGAGVERAGRAILTRRSRRRTTFADFEALVGWVNDELCRYAAELGLVGVRERALAVGQTRQRGRGRSQRRRPPLTLFPRREGRRRSVPSMGRPWPSGHSGGPRQGRPRGRLVQVWYSSARWLPGTV